MSYFAAIYGSVFLRIFSLVLLGSATCSFSFITLSIIFKKIPEFPTLQTLVKTKVENYFININQIYVKKGFWWRIAPESLYIEMRIPEKEPAEVRDENNESDQMDNDRNASKQMAEEIKKPYPMDLTSNIASRRKNEQEYSRRSKGKYTSKVAPIMSNETEKRFHDDYRSPDEASNNKTFQSQPIRFRNMNKEINNELSRNGSEYEKINYTMNYKSQKKSDNSRIDYFNDNKNAYRDDQQDPSKNYNDYDGFGNLLSHRNQNEPQHHHSRSQSPNQNDHTGNQSQAKKPERRRHSQFKNDTVEKIYQQFEENEISQNQYQHSEYEGVEEGDNPYYEENQNQQYDQNYNVGADPAEQMDSREDSKRMEEILSTFNPDP